MLQWERELVGVYISEHPLQQVADRLSGVVTMYTNQITEDDHNRQVAMAGTIKYVRRHVAKSGKPMAFAGLEDLYGQIEVVIWPSTWDETQEVWEPDRILLLRGKLDTSRGEPKLLCEEATTNFDLLEAVKAPADTTPLWVAATPLSFDGESPSSGASGSNTASRVRIIAPDAAPQLEPPPEWEPDESASDEWDEPADEVTEFVKEAESGPSAGGGPEAEPEPDLELGVADQEQILPDSVAKPQPPVPVQANRAERQVEGPRHLRVHLQRSGDDARDRRKLERVHGALISFPGPDHFSLVLVSEDGSGLEIDFPGDTTRYCDSLVSKLERIVGDSAIQVEPLSV
jgi:DNA polymerase-3 subunit alpha